MDNIVLLEKLWEQSSELTLWADSVWKTREQVWQSSYFVNYGRCVTHKFIPVGTLQHLTWIFLRERYADLTSDSVFIEMNNDPVGMAEG